ncbi:MAG: hypothetical protein AAGU11_03040 [Syntrophobacteraceae bacterium]
MRKTESTARRVRNYVSQLKGAFSPKSVAAALELEPKRIHSVFSDMIVRGEVEKLGFASYRYRTLDIGVRSTQKVRPRVFKAMHIRGTFSAREIAVLTDADRTFVYRIVRELVAASAIEFVCDQAVKDRVIEKVYRVKHRDDFYRQYVLPFQRVAGRSPREE